MMTIDEIRALIASDEHRTLELKKTTGELKDGISRIIEVCREHGAQGPEWTSELGRVTVTFNRTNDHVERRSDRADDRADGEVNDKVMAILAFCMKPRSRREILTHIGLKMHSDNYNRYIKPLLESGQLEQTRPSIPNSPLQRYVTKIKAK